MEVEPELMDLVPAFIENRREDVGTLREAVRDGDVETVEEVAHRMKGLGGGYGFDYVSTAGTALVELARTGRLEEAGPWLDGLEDYLDRVEPEEA